MRSIGSLIRDVRLLLASGLLVLLVAACSSPQGDMMTAAEVTAEPPVFADLPAVPLDVTAPRDLAAVEVAVQNGADAISKSSGAVVAGSQLNLSATPQSLEYAIYAFAPGEDELKSIEAALNTTSGDQVWLGIANYGPKTWEFAGPFPASGPAMIDNLDAGFYVSPGGNAYLVIVAYDSTSAAISTVEFTTDDAPPNFSLSGNLTSSVGGVALSGVALTLDPGGATALSDLTGHYVFPSVPEGQYKITPTLAGYSFSPPFYNLTLLGLATDVDFVGVPDA